MPEEILKFIDWIGLNQFHRSTRTGCWIKNVYMYGDITHSEDIAKTTEELYKLYKANL